MIGYLPATIIITVLIHPTGIIIHIPTIMATTTTLTIIHISTQTIIPTTTHTTHTKATVNTTRPGITKDTKVDEAKSQTI